MSKDFTGCPFCGGHHVIPKPHRKNSTTKYLIYQCVKCGNKWSAQIIDGKLVKTGTAMVSQINGSDA